MPEAKPDLMLVGGMTTEMRDLLNAHFTVHDMPKGDALDAFLTEKGESIVAVATNGGDGLKTEVMDRLPNLKVISNYGVGYDAIDATHAASRGIVVTHTPNVLNDEVANTAILLWLATSRKLAAYDAYVRAGRWEKEGGTPLTKSPQGRTVGIVGLGRIGQAIADRLPVFGARVVYHSRSKKDVAYDYFADLAEMARAADVLIVITPGGAETKHLIDRDVIDALGPEGILVNVARGSVVDETALIAALQEGRLWGAGLDVFEGEPHVPEAFFGMENVVLQPHIGSATKETRAAMGQLTCDNLIRYFEDGTTLTPVPECQDL